jgi:preprotein translocase SecE subunit
MAADKTLGEQPERRRRTLTGKSREALREAAKGEERAVATKARTAAPARRERDDDEDEKPRGIAGVFVGLREYFEGVQSEARKVVWPTPEDTRRLTITVLITLVIASIVLGLIVFVFTELFRVGLQEPIVLLGFMAVVVVAAFAVWRINSRRAAS